MARTISAASSLDCLNRGTHSLIDVRSEGEFAKASIPGFRNAPILTNEERHAVGLCYRLQGQQAAIDLGYQLVNPSRENRVSGWIDLGSGHKDLPILVSCWRGGMRSQFATEWIHSRGRDAWRIEGGYKAVRAELMNEFLKPKLFYILAGRTGSGKTELLKQISIEEKIDIENLAAHRGSSFGRILERPQPSQATFENALALGLRTAIRPILLEDESKVIGRLHLPEPFFRAMSSSSIIQLDVLLAERCRTIYQEYVANPLAKGTDRSLLKTQLIGSVLSIKKRFGGALTEIVIKLIESAFARQDEEMESHGLWIECLLTEYYDRAYDHFDSRNQRNIAFRGNYEECKQWIISQYV
ncbi:MAG: tRNA 2-selenouridine(34) synthase MnmH [Oligoflexus sp.]|nr:tRNA 2-selenouridine(34) synthase MnmH [Oligoflexus sp.]